MKKVGAELVKRDLVNENLGIFTFKLHGKINFEPGQFNGLSIIKKDGTTITRSYSMSSTPKDLPLVEFFVRWVRKGGKREDGEGQLTHELFSPHVDKLKFEMLNKGMGKLKIKKSESRNRLYICTGTGLGPFMSLLRESMNKDENLEGSILIHGVATKQDLAYQEELNEIATKTGLKIIQLESREESSEYKYVSELFFERSPQQKGRINSTEIENSIQQKKLEHAPIKKFLDEEFTPKNYVVMLCGNPAMINNMTKALEGHGFKNEKDIIAEKYWVES